jgi:hypothetical protein
MVNPYNSGEQVIMSKGVTGLERKKTTFYIEKGLHSAVRIAAIKMDITVTEFIENALKEKLNKEGFEWHDGVQEKEQS